VLRLLIILVVGFFIYRLFKAKGLTWPEAKSGKSRPVAGAQKPQPLVQDPVCKTYVVKGKAITYQGHYFCSEKCCNDFITKKET